MTTDWLIIMIAFRLYLSTIGPTKGAKKRLTNAETIIDSAKLMDHPVCFISISPRENEELFMILFKLENRNVKRTAYFECR